MKKASLFIGLLLITSVLSRAQSPWLNDAEPSLVVLEVLRPDLNEESGGFSVAAFITGRYAVGNQIRLVAELPISHRARVEDNGRMASAHTVLGNSYLGAELHGLFKQGVTRKSFLEFGVRIPILPEPSFPDRLGSFTGIIAARDRFDAFTSKFSSVKALMNLVIEADDVFSLRVRTGPSYLIYTGDEPEDLFSADRDNELYFQYALQLWFRTQIVTAAFGITGLHLATEDGSFGDRTLHQFSGLVQGNFDRIQPGLFLRVPLEENIITIFPFVYGVLLNVKLP